MHLVAGGPSPEEVHPNEVGDVAGPRPFRDLLGGTGLGDPALLHDDEPLGQRDGLHRVVRHQQADAVVAVELAAQLTARLQPGARVEGGQGFVEQEQARLRRQRPGQGDPLRLPAGQLLRLAPAVLAEPHPLEPLGGPGPGLGLSARRGCAARRPRSRGRRGEGRAGSSGRRRPPAGLRAGRARRLSCRRGPARRAPPAPRRGPRARPGPAGAWSSRRRWARGARRSARAARRVPRRVRACRAGPGPGRSGPARRRSAQDTPSHRSRRPTSTASDTSSSTRLRTIAVSGRDDSSDR